MSEAVSRREKIFEVIATLLLGFTALATAWSGYQASLWDGIQSSDSTQASAARTEASQLRTTANQYRLADLGVFESYIDATLTGRAEVATFYRERFRPEFEVAFQAWLAEEPFDDPLAPPSPFAMPEYDPAAEEQADDFEAQAHELFEAGEDADAHSDAFTLGTLIFAVVLFFTAISERFDFVAMRITLLSLAAVGFVFGLVVVLGEPITTA